MTDPQAVLALLPVWGFGLVLLISRIGAAAMMLPGVGEVDLPTTVRAGFALALTALLLPVIAPMLPRAPASPLLMLGMVAAEIATGLWLGWLPRLLMQALSMAGQFTASMVGVASVLQPDPALGPQATALARLFSLAAPVVLFASGLYVLPLAALAGSYHLIAPGTLLPAADTVPGAVGAVAEAFALALRLAAPFVAVGLLWQGGLGLLARLVPNLQVFAAAMPGQILAGLVLLPLLAGAMLSAWQGELRNALALLPGL